MQTSGREKGEEDDLVGGTAGNEQARYRTVNEPERWWEIKCAILRSLRDNSSKAAANRLSQKETFRMESPDGEEQLRTFERSKEYLDEAEKIYRGRHLRS